MFRCAELFFDFRLHQGVSQTERWTGSKRILRREELCLKHPPRKERTILSVHCCLGSSFSSSSVHVRFSAWLLIIIIDNCPGFIYFHIFIWVSNSETLLAISWSFHGHGTRLFSQFVNLNAELITCCVSNSSEKNEMHK